MRLTLATVVFGLIASAIALPVPASKHTKRGVLTQQSYADFQISDGVAGNSVAEVTANFPVSSSSPAPTFLNLTLPFMPPPL